MNDDERAPESMTETERMREIARILAAGIERMHKPKNCADIENNSVDSTGEESVYA